MSDQIFASSHNALLFAFNFSHQAYEPPLMNRLAWGPTEGISKGLSGTDGAGQAGMILDLLRKLTYAQQFVLIVKFAPSTWPCQCRSQCCQGFKRNMDWEEAVNQLGLIAVTEVLTGSISNRQLRNAMIKKSFGFDGMPISDIAKRCGVSERTAAGQHAQIRRWLRGERSRKEVAEPGLIEIALERADRILCEAGLIRQTANA